MTVLSGDERLGYAFRYNTRVSRTDRQTDGIAISISLAAFTNESGRAIKTS